MTVTFLIYLYFISKSTIAFSKYSKWEKRLLLYLIINFPNSYRVSLYFIISLKTTDTVKTISICILVKFNVRVEDNELSLFYFIFCFHFFYIYFLILNFGLKYSITLYMSIHTSGNIRIVYDVTHYQSHIL